MTFTITSKKYGSHEVLIDDADYDRVKDYTWGISKSRNIMYIKTNRNTLALHRLIMNCPDDKQVDHINHNTLDNRKENLRVCTHVENNRNKPKRSKLTSSIYKGVHKEVIITKNGSYTKFRPSIKYGGKVIHLGLFDSEIEAATIYNNAAIIYHKEFACLNKFNINMEL